MRFLGMILTVFALAAGLADTLAEVRAEAPRYRGELRYFTAGVDGQAVEIKENDLAGSRFAALEPFFSLGVSCPSYRDNDGDLTLSLYRWSKNPAETLSAQPLATQTFVNFVDNDHLRMTFETLPPGDYFWTLGGARGQVGVWKDLNAYDGVTSYFNGEPADGIYRFSLGVETPFPFSGSPETLAAIQGQSTAPPEPVPSADSALVNRDVCPDTWDAIDELGRVLPDAAQTGPVREDRQVGIFYWTWHDSLNYPGPFDVTKTLAEHPEALQDLNHPSWGPFGARHHWGNRFSAIIRRLISGFTASMPNCSPTRESTPSSSTPPTARSPGWIRSKRS